MMGSCSGITMNMLGSVLELDDFWKDWNQTDYPFQRLGP